MFMRVNSKCDFAGKLTPDISVLDHVLQTECRIGIVGDWGTGELAAVNVIRGLLDREPDLGIPLGDIYPSSTELECDRAFRKVIREDLKYTKQVYVLAGNHDYYSGGEGYYKRGETPHAVCDSVREVLAALTTSFDSDPVQHPAPPRQQPESFLASSE